MNVPHQQPHPTGKDDLDRALADLSSSLNHAIDGDEAKGLRERLGTTTIAPTPPIAGLVRPPVAPAGGGRGREWGPSTTRFDRPLVVLEATVVRAYELHRETGELLARLTGQTVSAVPPRPLAQQALLPSIVALASEIEGVLNEVKRLVEHMQGRL